MTAAAVTFLGSRARELLLGTGARSNAYTDFHHTVFHTHAPTAAPDGAPLLGQACAALADVAFTPLFAEARVAKERAAVMSEAQSACTGRAARARRTRMGLDASLMQTTPPSSLPSFARLRSQ